jgi:hypothetical protein
LRIDLGSAISIEQVSTYSWHPGARGPQVYTLWAAAGAEAGFVSAPAPDQDPAALGWRLLAKVDTRPADGGEGGGQHAAAIFDSDGPLGRLRYLLFEIVRIRAADNFDNTFFSEIDVRAAAAGEEPAAVADFEIEGGAYRFSLDT